MTFSTIGYEGIGIDIFLNHLRHNEIKMVADVRKIPLSRKPGFSQKTLRSKLAQCHIAYKHFPLLGCPSEIRKKYKEDRNWDYYCACYNAYLKENLQALDELVSYLQINCALMCFEADFNKCHRTLIGKAIEHLYPGLSMSHISAGSAGVKTMRAGASSIHSTSA